MRRLRVRSPSAPLAMTLVLSGVPRVSAIADRPCRLTADEFERIEEFLDGRRVELLDGHIVARGDVEPPHAVATDQLRRQLDRLVPQGRFVREEKPVRIPDYDEPVPDVAVAKGTPRGYANRHPGPADIALLVEVSESSLDRDQGRKQLIYGRAGIPVYWIVNLVDLASKSTRFPMRSGMHRGPISALVKMPRSLLTASRRV
jgi:Uma2 family endonuclease